MDRNRRWIGVLGMALGAGLGLSACSSGGSDFNPASLASGGRDLEKEQESLREFAAVEVCPQIQIREGTQAVRRYASGRDGDPQALAYQGTIGRFARECVPAPGGGTSIKVGVAGRVLSGPAGAPQSVSLPLRVVLVKNGSEVLFSELQQVSVAVPGGTGSIPWQQVVAGLNIPPQAESASYLIYVGFDETGG